MRLVFSNLGMPRERGLIERFFATIFAPAQRWEKGAFLPRMPESLERLYLPRVKVAKARKSA
jgi:hypothetical protein